MKTPPASWFAGLAFLATGGLLFGQNFPPQDSVQIGWASDAFATNLRADGVTTFEEAAQEIFFELGTFTAGFDPRTATPEECVSHWLVLQTTSYDMSDQQFIQTATLDSNDSPFYANAQAYIWGYTSKTVAPGSEWIIMGATDWKWPSVTATQPSIFSVSQANPGDAFYGSVNATDGSYQMQLQYLVVPEPSTPVLLLTASVGLVFRRRRRHVERQCSSSSVHSPSA